MEENKIIQDAVEEIKTATEEDLMKVVEGWFEKTRTDALRLGAYYISAGVYGSINKHLNKQAPSLRDYKRCIDEILKIVSVQLKQNDTVQNDLEEKI